MEQSYEFFVNHPSYWVLLLVNVFILIRILMNTKKRGGGGERDNGDGDQFWPTDPKLDLPPGVILPQDDTPEGTPVKPDLLLQD